MKKNTTGFKGSSSEGFSRNLVWNGTDPEAELLNSRGTMVSASSIGLRTGSEHEIGADGAGTPAEIRPKPGKPETVVKNIKKILKRFARRFPGYTLSTEGNRTAIGAHIHVSVKDLRITDRQAIEISKVIDDFLGRVVINAMAGSARQYSGYNRLTAYRMQTYNSTTTGFEYRSCPAGIMLNPELFKLSMKIVRMVTWTMFNKRRFSYETPVPTAHDYSKICHFNAEEYTTFKRLVAEYETADKDVLKSWGIQCREAAARVVTRHQSFRLTIQFHDDWDEITRATIRAAFSRYAPVNNNVVLRLFGLRADRGDVVSGIVLTGYRSIDHASAGRHLDHIGVGLAHSLRNSRCTANSLNELIENLRSLVIFNDRA
jgi:hypothetical protein